MGKLKYIELIDKMTLEEKASLMSGKDFWTTQELPQYNIPSIFLADGPHGLRKQAAAADQLGLNESIPATCYPTSATVANSWDVKLGEEMASYLGREAVSQKVNVSISRDFSMFETFCRKQPRTQKISYRFCC